MPLQQDRVQVPVARWKAWLGLFLVIPLAALSGAMLLGLYRDASIGQLTTLAKSHRSTSRTIEFSENPTLFLLFFAFHAAFAAVLVVVTVAVARLSVRRLRARP